MYVCKPCFEQRERCCKTIPAVQEIVSDLHGTLSLWSVPVMVTAVFPDVEKLSPHVQLSPERPQAPQVAVHALQLVSKVGVM